MFGTFSYLIIANSTLTDDGFQYTASVRFLRFFHQELQCGLSVLVEIENRSSHFIYPLEKDVI